MTRLPLIRGLLLVPVLVAAGCAPVPVRTASDAPSLAAQAARETALAADADWSLSGRLAVDANGQGGSGRIDWAQRGDDYTIRLSAPVTRRSWVLEKQGDVVVLSGLDGGERRGTDPEAMLEDATGWRIPVAALAAWARGARAAGPATIEFDPAGLPALIAQHGWTVDYREWDTSQPPRPRRVFATQGDRASVRLVVEAWGDPVTGAVGEAFPAPAKLNLFLRITGRRPDGYHALQTVFQLLDWGDTVRLGVRGDGRVVRAAASGYDVPADRDLVVRAAIALQEVAKITQGVDIAVEKAIPTGGGFGGGSSDAATVLVALNRLWGAGLDEDALAAIGLGLGADVPVFVRGRSAWAGGVGERLEPVSLPPSSYLIVDSGVHVPTGELFQAADLTRDAVPATMRGFISGSVSGNAFEPVLRRRSPVVDDLLRTLSRLGPSALTGTGGGCFVRFGTRAEAEAALAHVPSGLRAWVADGVDVSPLHRAMGLH